MQTFQDLPGRSQEEATVQSVTFTWTPDNPRPGVPVLFEPVVKVDSDGEVDVYHRWTIGSHVVEDEILAFAFGTTGDHLVRLDVRLADGRERSAAELVTVASAPLPTENPAARGATDDDPEATLPLGPEETNTAADEASPAAGAMRGDEGTKARQDAVESPREGAAGQPSSPLPPEPPGPREPPEQDPAQGDLIGESGGDPSEADGYTGLPGRPQDCTSGMGRNDTANLVPTSSIIERRVVDVVLVTDATFRDLHGQDWPLVARDLLRATEATYEAAFNLSLHMAGLLELPGASYDATEASDDAGDVINATRALVEGQYAWLDRDVVFTLVGTDIHGDLSGGADCIGGARYRDAMYAWGEGVAVQALELDPQAQTVPASPPATKTMAREMAHLLGADHPHATCGATLPSQNSTQAPLETCTLLFELESLAGSSVSEVNKALVRHHAALVDL